MRTLELNEIQAISGGFEPVMILSFVAGVQELSLTKTLIFSSAFYGTIGAGLGLGVGAVAGLLNLSSALTGALVGGTCGAAFGAIDGFLAYEFGSLFSNPGTPAEVATA